MSPEETIKRAERARQLLEDPLMVEAFSIIEKDITEMWVNCPERDIEGQRLLQMHIRNARKLKGILMGVMESGKLEQLRASSLKDNVLKHFPKWSY
jgi:hypothetical protein